MMAAAPRGATRLKADWGGGWGGAAVKSSGSECAWCHENVIEVKSAPRARWAGVQRDVPVRPKARTLTQISLIPPR